ncbi:hypothetical protein MPTA5024_18750 [Microbispora sp. ATCC PTA-5024]|nr:hypothetical protein MPTA5024_18750 [Microbispora sp. ATCC PTA-5024]
MLGVVDDCVVLLSVGILGLGELLGGIEIRFVRRRGQSISRATDL